MAISPVDKAVIDPYLAGTIERALPGVPVFHCEGSLRTEIGADFSRVLESNVIHFHICGTSDPAFLHCLAKVTRFSKSFSLACFIRLQSHKYFCTIRCAITDHIIMNAIG